MSGDGVVFESGDVVFGEDQFKGAGTARPWFVISNHEGKPFHGEQYIALTLTTKSWHDGLVEIQRDDWVEGGTPADSRIGPWGVQSIAHEDIDRWQGRLRQERVKEAVEALRKEIAY